MRFILLFLMLFISGCGVKTIQGPPGETGPAGPRGEQGIPGSDGQDAVMEIIDPCGDHPTKSDDVVFVVDGLVYGTVKANGKTFLSQLKPGVYVTQDGTSCTFVVTVNNEVVY